jgi:hypothetical protein
LFRGLSIYVAAVVALLVVSAYAWSSAPAWETSEAPIPLGLRLALVIAEHAQGLVLAASLALGAPLFGAAREAGRTLHWALATLLFLSVGAALVHFSGAAADHADLAGALASLGGHDGGSGFALRWSVLLWAPLFYGGLLWTVWR